MSPVTSDARHYFAIHPRLYLRNPVVRRRGGMLAAKRHGTQEKDYAARFRGDGRVSVNFVGSFIKFSTQGWVGRAP